MQNFYGNEISLNWSDILKQLDLLLACLYLLTDWS